MEHASLRASHGLDDSVLEDVRAVSDSLSVRVPELIEDFYRWLSRLPEFGQFLWNPHVLAHVKGQAQRAKTRSEIPIPIRGFLSSQVPSRVRPEKEGPLA